MDTSLQDENREASGLEGERPVWSKLAIATFALSLASPLALIHIMFWPALFITVFFAVASVVLTTIGGRSVRGGVLACLALFFSLFFLSMAISQYASHQVEMTTQARAFAEDWFKLIADGKLNEAHQMSLSPDQRESPEIPVAEAYRLNGQLSSARDSFFLQPPLKYIVSDPNGTSVRFVDVAGRDRDDRTEAVRLRFVIRYVEQDVPRETKFTLSVARYFKPNFEDYRWQCRGITQIENK